MLDNYHYDNVSRFDRGPHVKLVPNSNVIQNNVTISHKSFVHECKVHMCLVWFLILNGYMYFSVFKISSPS